MSIDPKKGGQCWSCTHCEDIATQTNNPSGSYYRKCTKSGHEYIDTCKFYCSDYNWDGVHDRYVRSSSSSSKSTSSSTSSTSTYKPSYTSGSSGTSYSASKKASPLPWVLLILLLLIYGGYFVVKIMPNDKPATPATEPTVQLVNPDYRVAYVNLPDTLNLRIGPAQTYDVITTMPNGAMVYVQETKNGWSYVTYQTQSGWCYTDHLDFED